MAQLAIQIDDDVMEKLQLRAHRHGRSTEKEVREILRNAVKSEDATPIGLGTLLTETFRGVGIEEEIPELRGYPVKPIKL
jgi:plasmid stability protein